MSGAMPLAQRAAAVTGAPSDRGRAMADGDVAGLRRTAQRAAATGCRIGCHRIAVAAAGAPARGKTVTANSRQGVIARDSAVSTAIARDEFSLSRRRNRRRHGGRARAGAGITHRS
jgi:hypothetical protein